MLLRLAEALWAVHAVLDAAPVDGVVVLVVQKQWRHHNHVCAVRHRVAEVAQLTVVTGHDCFSIAVAGICWGAQDDFVLLNMVKLHQRRNTKTQGVGLIILLIEAILITLAGAGWVRYQLFTVFGCHVVSLPTFSSSSPVYPCRIGIVWANSAPYAHSVSLFIVLQKLC